LATLPPLPVPQLSPPLHEPQASWPPQPSLMLPQVAFCAVQVVFVQLFPPLLSLLHPARNAPDRIRLPRSFFIRVSS
jgi:hypothetical protein